MGYDSLFRPCPLCGNEPSVRTEGGEIVIGCYDHYGTDFPLYFCDCHDTDENIIKGWDEECKKLVERINDNFK